MCKWSIAKIKSCQVYRIETIYFNDSTITLMSIDVLTKQTDGVPWQTCAEEQNIEVSSVYMYFELQILQYSLG